MLHVDPGTAARRLVLSRGYARVGAVRDTAGHTMVVVCSPRCIAAFCGECCNTLRPRRVHHQAGLGGFCCRSLDRVVT